MCLAVELEFDATRIAARLSRTIKHCDRQTIFFLFPQLSESFGKFIVTLRLLLTVLAISVTE